MRFSSLLVLVLVTTLYIPTSPLMADTYQIVGLGIDNVYFYGMDDSGHVVLYATYFSCGDPSQGCYEDFLNGTPVDRTSVAPTFAWDYSAGGCVSPQPMSSPCIISNNGRTAVIALLQPF